MPRLTFTDAAVEPLWSHLTMDVQPGEFIAVLGPNGVGKSTLLSAALGIRKLSKGTVVSDGSVGYIPQQRMFDPDLAVRSQDLVELAAEQACRRRGKRLSRSERRELAKETMTAIGAAGLYERRVGTLSGGQQQLIRQAQALVTDPDFLLCDEPLLSLDPAAQKATVGRLDRRRREHNTAIVFVTHSINPIVDITDRVLYITPHGHRLGPVGEILTSETLSELYQTEMVVAKVNGKLVIA